ncbi:hypothetical protein HYU11_01865 [Candidatus Woesearchaeota archaeon]|nr:hypothetical protein [Candidatus Woesearchaeota archaeon]
MNAIQALYSEEIDALSHTVDERTGSWAHLLPHIKHQPFFSCVVEFGHFVDVSSSNKILMKSSYERILESMKQVERSVRETEKKHSIEIENHDTRRYLRGFADRIVRYGRKYLPELLTNSPSVSDMLRKIGDEHKVEMELKKHPSLYVAYLLRKIECLKEPKSRIRSP